MPKFDLTTGEKVEFALSEVVGARPGMNDEGTIVSLKSYVGYQITEDFETFSARSLPGTAVVWQPGDDD